MADPRDALTVSVALCTYNSGSYLDAQLESIFDLTPPPWEIVISDDGSTDDTVRRARSFVERANETGIRFRVIVGTGGLGVTANFQRAIEACSGELIALCDHDDVWHPDRLSSAVPSFANDNALLFQHGDARLVGAAGEPLGIGLFEALEVSRDELDGINAGRAFEIYLRRNLATGATAIVRRSLVEKALPFPASWVHDEWLATIAAALGRVEVLNRELIDYRQHGANQIGVQKPTMRYRVRRMLSSRGVRNARLARRAVDLAERLDEMQVAAPYRELAHAKARFEAARAALPANRLRRIGPVVRELRAGSYARFASQGRLDVVRDLLQPV